MSQRVEAQAEVHYTPEDRAHDPREQQGWFLRLPEHAKQDLREKWKIQEGGSEAQIARRKATMWRYVLESVGIFVVPLFLFMSLGWLSLLCSIVVGAAVGFLAARIRAGTFQYPFLGFAGWLVLWVLSGLGLSFLTLFWYIGWTGALGAVHHLQKFDGTEA
jgi:hypothetical protein